MTAILGLNAYHGDAAAALVDRRRARRRRRGGAVQPRQALRRLPGAGRRLVPRGRRARRRTSSTTSRSGATRARTSARKVAAHDPRTRAEPALRRRRGCATRAKVRDVAGALAEALGVDADELRARRSTTSSTTRRTSRARSSSRRSTRRRSSRSTASATSPRRCSRVGRGNRFEVLDRVLFPHSLGIFYTAVTQWLGFPKYGDEGKVMGLAPYGDAALPATQMRELVQLDGDALRARASTTSRTTREGVDMTWDERLADDRPHLLRPDGASCSARRASRGSELDRRTTRTSPPRCRRCSRRRTCTSSATLQRAHRARRTSASPAASR